MEHNWRRYSGISACFGVALAGALGIPLQAANYVLVTETVIVSPEDFTSGRVIQFARSRLPHEANWDLLVVTYRSRPPIPEAGLTHMGYGGWIAMRDSHRPNNDAAELVATRRGAALRIKLRSGGVQKKVLRGDDPLHFDLDGNACDVLEVDLRRNRVLLVADITSEQEAQRAAQQSFELLPADPLSVYIRRTPWFIPLANPFFPFFPPTRTPTLEEWQKEREFSCHVRGLGVRCTSLTGTWYEEHVDRIPVQHPAPVWLPPPPESPPAIPPVPASLNQPLSTVPTPPR